MGAGPPPVGSRSLDALISMNLIQRSTWLDYDRGKLVIGHVRSLTELLGVAGVLDG